MVTMSKKKLTLIMLAALVVLSAVGVTLALYMGTIDPVVNHFSMKTDGVVDGEIIEEGWEDNVDDPTKAIPGNSFDKKVYVHNLSQDDMYIYVGLMMEIKKGPAATAAAVTQAELDAILAVMSPNHVATSNWYNATNWERVLTNPTIQAKEIFIYKVRIGDDANTEPLFDKVDIFASATPTQMKAVEALGGFNIVMTGAVIQGDVDDTLTPQIRADLIGLLEGTVTP